MIKEHNIYGGGAKTNENGLFFEKYTSLNDCLEDNGYTINDINVFDAQALLVGLSTPKMKLYTFLEGQGIDYTKYNSKRWSPDDAFINFSNKTVYIIEKKYQESPGSVDEKLPNCSFKKWEYQKLFRTLGYEVKFIYVLNDFFKKDVYRDYFDYFDMVDCDYYFENLPLEAIGLEKEDN